MRSEPGSSCRCRGYAGYAFVHSFVAFLPLVVAVRVAERGARPAVNALTAQLALDTDRARLFGLMRALRSATAACSRRPRWRSGATRR